MRFDTEHAYDQHIYDIPTIKEHIIEEWKFRKLLFTIVEKHGSIAGMNLLIDAVCAIYSREFTPPRKAALKRLVMKIYTAYDYLPPKRQLAAVLKELKYPITKIADILQVTRQTVYWYLSQEDEVPTTCLLTYGEYNLMLDFMDAWHELGSMDNLEKAGVSFDTRNL